MKPRPLWRWWLFCAVLWLHRHTSWRWVDRLMSWAVLSEWLGWDGKPLEHGGDEPF